MRKRLLGAIELAAMLIFYACLPAASPGGDLAACVAADALEGKSIPQIALDCKADIAAVIEAILTSNMAGVPATAAYAEALRTRATLQSFDGGTP